MGAAADGEPQVPAGLDAICRKAMALRPEDRYGSPLELAEEVEHWLADEPVSAYREPAAVRVRRWMRQRPKRVTAAAVLLLATVVGLTIGTVLLDGANRQLRGTAPTRGGTASTGAREFQEGPGSR